MSEVESRGSSKLAIKAAFWYVLSNFLVKALAFITTPIFARLMNTVDYGEFSNYANWQSTLLIITGAELYSTLNRAYYDYKDEFDQYASSMVFLNLGITLAFYVLFLVSGEWVFKIVAIPREFIHILFITLLFQACKEIYMARERTLYHYKSVAKLSVINLVLPTIISVLMVISATSADRLGARIYGFYLPSSLIGLFCAFVLITKGKASFKLEHCKYALKLSLPLLVHYLTAYLLTSSNTIVTKSVLGASDAALASITTSTIHIFTILMQALSGAMTTWLMDNLEQKNVVAIKKGLNLFVLGTAVLSLGVMIVSPEVIFILGGSKYMAATLLMPGMMLAVSIQSITTIFTIILNYYKSVVKTALYTAIVAGGSILAKIVLLDKMGLDILPWINVIAFLALFIVNYVLTKKVCEEKVIDLKVFVLTIFIIFVAALICPILYANTLLRYAIVVVAGIIVLAVLYKYRELVMSFVKKKLKK